MLKNPRIFILDEATSALDSTTEQGVQECLRNIGAGITTFVIAHRLSTLKAADKMDKIGNKGARSEIAMIKVVAPSMALRVIDRAVQIHGGAGVSGDFGLSAAWAGARTLRLADGPDEVHRASIAKLELGRQVDIG